MVVLRNIYIYIYINIILYYVNQVLYLLFVSTIVVTVIFSHTVDKKRTNHLFVNLKVVHKGKEYLLQRTPRYTINAIIANT